MKRVYTLCMLTALLMIAAAFGLHAVSRSEERHIKVGFIFVGDEITPYTKNFIKARDKAIGEFGDSIECVTKYNVAEDQIEDPLAELIAEQCDYIIAASYGYGPVVKAAAAEHPEIQFCVPTGDNANTEPVLENYHTCMGTIYQGRYVCGVAAGIKLRDMIDSGVIAPEEAKIGYVAAFPFPEVISGYTAFYLGVHSKVPEAVMLVKYADTWSDYSLEKKLASELIDDGCIIISQHSDTVGPATACENAETRVPVYHVGYNQSMTGIAPASSIISCSVDYSHYFEQSIYALINGRKIEDCIDGRTYGQDAMAGLDKGWVRILDINRAIVPADTESELAAVVKSLEDGSLQVFEGDFTGTDPNDESRTIDLRTPYIENEYSSSPTFSYVLDDVITVLP